MRRVVGFLAGLVALAFLALSVVPAQGAEARAEQATAAKLVASGREAASQGALQEAEEALQGALAACRAGGDERCQWEALSSLAPVALARGSKEEALEAAQEAAALAHRLRDRPSQGESYILLARVLAETGQPEEARSAAERALAVGGELKLAGIKSAAFTVMGDLAQAEGKLKESCQAYEKALADADGAGGASYKIGARMGLGSCLLEEGEFGQAREVLEEAFLEALRKGDKLSVARLLKLRGRLEAHSGEPAQAEELLVESLGKLRSIGASAYAEGAELELKKLRAEASLPKEEDRNASAVSGDNSPFDLTSENPRYLDYFAKAHRQIERVFVVPEGVETGELKGSSRVAFTVDKSGRLKEARLETSSGSPVLDHAALTTLRLAEPFEPFPGGVAKDEITIVVRFDYEPEVEQSPPEPQSG